MNEVSLLTKWDVNPMPSRKGIVLKSKVAVRRVGDMTGSVTGIRAVCSLYSAPHEPPSYQVWGNG